MHWMCLGFWSTWGFSKDPDTFDKRAQKVTLMTMHSAKGLEISRCFCDRMRIRPDSL